MSDTAVLLALEPGLVFTGLGRVHNFFFIWASYLAVLRILLLAGLGGAGDRT